MKQKKNSSKPSKEKCREIDGIKGTERMLRKKKNENGNDGYTWREKSFVEFKLYEKPSFFFLIYEYY